MKNIYLMQSFGNAYDKTVLGMIDNQLNQKGYDQLYIAMAYVTIAGVRDILDVSKEPMVSSRGWAT